MDGFLILSRDPPLKWRLVLLAMETALEDSMVSVIIPIIALNITATMFGSVDKTTAALCSVVAIAVGKLGGVIAGMYMSAKSPTINSSNGYKHLFVFIFLSSLSLVLLPIGYKIMLNSSTVHHPIVPNVSVTNHFKIFSGIINSHVLGPLSMLMGVFFFFVFSTAPKIGFATLIQNLVTSESVAAKVFGFVGLFVTVTDAVLITAVNLVFYLCGPAKFQTALWILFLVYIGHGIIELIIGPRLILSELSASQDVQNEDGQNERIDELFIRTSQQQMRPNGNTVRQYAEY